MSRAYATENSREIARSARRSDEQSAATELCKVGLSPSRFRLWIQSDGFDKEARPKRRILPRRAANRQDHAPSRGEDEPRSRPCRSRGSQAFDFQPFGGWGWRWERDVMVLFCDGGPAPASVTERLDLAVRAAGSED